MKYKLIKIYPGSPVLGTIVEKGYTGYVPEGHSKSLGSWSLSNVLVENYPGFWQPENEWVSKLTNSPIGSLHWLNTNMGFILHLGEAFEEHGWKYQDKISAPDLKEYGKEMFLIAKEIMEYFKDKLK